MVRVPQRYELFLQWMIFVGVLVFFVSLAWQYGTLEGIFETDPTYISFLIGLMFLGGTGHCGIRALYLAKQMNLLREVIHCSPAGSKLPVRDLEELLALQDRTQHRSLASAYLQAVLRRYSAHPTISELRLEHSQLTEILSEQARGQHEMGWFVTGLLLKLGLLGTVIGFVMMLSSVSGMESLDFSDVQQVLSNMTVGMGVALSTTLIGLMSSMLLGFQYLLLDRGADTFITQIVHFAHTVLIPHLESGPLPNPANSASGPRNVE